MIVQLPAWHDFYLGTLSASAALMGLLFVAVSLHLRVLAGSAHPVLRAEARTVYLGYLGAFVSSMLALIPDQGLRLLGLEMLAYAAGHLLLLSQSNRESFGPDFRDARLAVIVTWLVGGIIIVSRWIAAAGLIAEVDWAIALLGATVVGSLVFSTYLSWDLVFRAARATPTV
jgi:hypothetical protein